MSRPRALRTSARPLRAAPRVGLFGLLGAGNVGNDSSLEAMMTYLRQSCPDALVDFMCAGPERVSAEYGTPAIPIRWYQAYEQRASGKSATALNVLGKGIDAVRTLDWVRRHDVVIVPGTGILETTMPQHPWGVPYAVFLLCAWGKLLGTKVALVSVGASNPKQRITRGLFTAAARLAFYRSFRDEQSRQAMCRTGLDTSHDLVYPDLAFSLPRPADDRGDPRTVGIGVMAFYGGNDERHLAEELYASYVDKMKQFARWLVDNGRRIRFFVGDSVDYSVVEEILADLRTHRPGLDPSDVVVGQISSWSDLTNQITLVGTVVAMRFHNLLCALRLCKPTLSIAYAPKNDALMADMGLGEFSMSVRSLEVDELIERFLELERRSPEVKAVLAQNNESKARMLEDQFTSLSALLFGARESVTL